jgi:type I restriction enzyme S subunit
MTPKRVPIESLYSGLYDGPHATPKPSEVGPVFLGIGNITEDGKLDLTDLRHIAEEDYAQWTRRVTPRPGDIVFTYEATLNRYAIIPDGFRGCLGRRTALIRPNPAAVNPRFLFFYFFSHDWRKTIDQNILSGATVDRIPLTKFPTFPIRLPERPVQDRIASILSAYDDLIENNTRRIRILEEMAQMIYREWFVNFRFPGHENVKMVESELGPIPEGWKAKSVGSTSVNFDSKRKPLSSMERAKRPGPYPYYGAARIFDFIDGYLFDGRYLLLAEDGSVITDDRHPVLQLTDGKFWPNNHTHVLLGQSPVSTYFLYLTMRQVDISGYITGAAQPKITQANLNRIPVLVPSEDLLQAFDRNCTPLLDEVAVLHRKQKNLRTTRDFLLPKLISGEVSVEGAEDTVLEAVG